MERDSVIRLVLLLLPLILFGPLGIDIYLPAIPSMASQFAASTKDIQVSLSVFILALGLGQPFFGPLADNYGRRPVALTATLLFLLGALLAVQAQSVSALLLGRLIQGLGACAASVVVFAVVRDRLSGNDCVRAYCYLNGTLCLAPALAPLLGAGLTLSLGWQANFLFLALFALLTLLLCLRQLHESRPAHTLRQPLLCTRPYCELWRYGAFRAYGIACLAAMGTMLTYVTLAPMVLMEQMGLNETEFALVFAGNAGLIMATSFTVPRLSRQLERHRVAELGTGLLLAGGAAMLFGVQAGLGVAGFMLPMALCSVGFSLTLGAASASAMAPFADRAGRAAALLGCLQMAGAAGVSFAASRLPLPAGESCALAIVLLSGCALLVLQRLPHRQQCPV
ncbi:Bcr/CflA family efflux MFS transporter [Oceanimonas sp. CHS3-5]|uniref:Bcr/CflA family efflux MFS transporter n=1 Tax=Oceanimonas sp. CHS3-5 TaxID=3068186 RepID=UPI00273DBA2D|nr:Bcr/CflA family efflux MFS transporter [Oceanimonas sp. CHS3-5]MDP5293084.1 Bcr/CflA family efflux MFS transporter [Oceanimonas sp. CHS3-5]